jgi:hypothetical protein
VRVYQGLAKKRWTLFSVFSMFFGMKTKPKVQVTEAEQKVLDGIELRLIESKEQERFDQLIREQHYLHSADWVGERLFYVAEYKGAWLALLAWTAAAHRLKGREAWIGWSEEQRRRRLSLVANNARFLILPNAHYPNLASRVMGMCLRRLSADWQTRYAHPIVVVESFVDGQLFRGTSYKVSGWQQLGQTSGYGRHGQDYYVKHDRPKQLWVKELIKGGCRGLRADRLRPKWAVVEEKIASRCTFTVPQLHGMRNYFRQIHDWRNRINFYPCESLLAVVLCATLCGVTRGQRDLAAFARTLTQAQRRALRFRKSKKTGKYPAPKETMFFRLLSKIDPHELEEALLNCQKHVLGPRSPEDELVAFDGKTLRSGGGMELTSGYLVNTGRWMGTEAVASKSNEIPATQRLLERMDLSGQTAVLDALHTQVDTARQIVQDCGGDYLLTVKGNQKGLQKTLQQLWDGRKAAFPPSTTHTTGGSNPGDQPRAH